MSVKQFHMIYALHNGNLVHISNVSNGLKCECFCPACNGKLIAKKGKVMMHHFAHYDSEECKYGYETSLHLAAKQMIMEHKKIMIPAVYLNFPGSGRGRILLSEAKEIKVDQVLLEQRQESIIPDVVLISDKKKIYVEIYVTHAVDTDKVLKIKNSGISTIEIDLSAYKQSLEKEDLEKIIFEDSEQKKWIYNSFEKECLQKFISVAKPKPIISRGYTEHVDYCPMSRRKWHGKPYANFIDDCCGCEFCISAAEDKIFCSAEAGIAKMEDFQKNTEERKLFYMNKCDDERYDCFSKRICPNCGGKLVERMGRYGDFWGCGNYPHCRFTVNIDKETGEIIMKS